MQYQAGIDLVLFGLLSMILMMLTIFSAVKAGQSISFQWKKAYFQAAVKKSITWHDFNEDFIETIENDCENIQKIFEKMVFLLFVICYYVTCWVYAILINTGLSIFMMLVIPAQLLLVFLIDSSAIKRNNEEHKSVEPFVQETLNSLSTIQENNAENIKSKEYELNIENFDANTAKRGTLHGVGLGLFFVVLFSFSVAILYLVSQLIDKRPSWWIGNYNIPEKEPISVFLCVLFSTFYLGWVMPCIRCVELGLKTLQKVHLAIVKIDKEDGFKRIDGLQGKVEFKNVYFKQLKNLSFVAQPGQSVGILADKVSEKGAIADLIAGFYYCESGSVLVDGLSIKEYLINDLREFVSVVPQNPMILHKSFRDNICLGSIYSDEDIEKAAKLTNVHDLIMSKGGYSAKTENLSLLEKQKISLTRVILRDPKVLVIDSIYSVFDAKNREEYSKIIEKCIKKRTSIVISEYPSVINFVENMIILNSGTVIDSGKFDEISQNPKLSALQKAESSSIDLKSPEANPQSQAKKYMKVELISKILKLESKYLNWLIFAVIIAITAGITFPIYGYFFGNTTANMLFLNGMLKKSNIIRQMLYRIIETLIIFSTLTILFNTLAKLAGNKTKDLRIKIMSILLNNESKSSAQPTSTKKISKILNDDCQNLGNVGSAIIAIIFFVFSSIIGSIYISLANDTKLGLVLLCFSLFIIASNL